MTIVTHRLEPFADQRPGTAGLRRPTAIFRQPGYLQALLQAIFEADPPPPEATLVVGGDGRFFCDEAARTAVAMGLANGYETVVVGQGSLMSTPAASALVRSRDAHGAIILSASHNPGGPDGDFGVKYNTRGGGPASPALTDKIYACTLQVQTARSMETAAFDLANTGRYRLGSGWVEVVDPVNDHLDLLAEQFDCGAITEMLARPGFRLSFDAMHAVTGPYAKRLFEDRLGAASGTVLRATPLPDFGGHHPDPHPDHLEDLFADLFGPTPATIGAASDGDGDRNMILGPRMMVSPGDSLAVMAANAHHIPAFKERGLVGVARSMPTSRAVDRVAARLGIPLYETPTGWKFFTTLLDAGRISLCGEESFGTGSDHVREKDGLWAVLFWLNLMAVRHMSIPELMQAHWAVYGRDAFQRHDYDGLVPDEVAAILKALSDRIDSASGTAIDGCTIVSARDFDYIDPVDGSMVRSQGLSFTLSPDARITYRLSGTGTRGSTLRVYLERHVPPDRVNDESGCLADLGRMSRRLADLDRIIGTDGPTSVI